MRKSEEMQVKNMPNFDSVLEDSLHKAYKLAFCMTKDAKLAKFAVDFFGKGVYNKPN